MLVAVLGIAVFGIGSVCALSALSKISDWVEDVRDRRQLRRLRQFPDLMNQLAWRARSRHNTGSAGRRGRRAWRQLAREAEHAPEGLAVDALWWSWLRAPDDAGWALLRRLRNQRAFTDLNAAIAAFPPSIDNWPAFAAFCVRNDLVPAEPVERARFYALTRQPEQRRALDPDGDLLAAAYRAADPEVRTALRDALASDGDLDVLRVVAGAGASSRVTDITVVERNYLTGQLVDRRDWAGLWRLAQNLSLLDAVAAVRMIDADWRPDRQRERDLFALLSRAKHDALLSARDALFAKAAIRIKVSGTVVAGALSADGRRVAVTTVPAKRSAQRRPADEPPPDGPRAATISVYALPGGQLVARHSTPMRDLSLLVYAADGTLIAVDSSFRLGRNDFRARVYRCPDAGRARRIAHDSWGIAALAAWGEGFAALYTNGHLAFHDRDGGKLGTRGLDLDGPVSTVGRAPLATVGADPGSGWLAAAYRCATPDDRYRFRGKFAAVEARSARDARVAVMEALLPRVTIACFDPPGHLIVARDNDISIERFRIGSIERFRIGAPLGHPVARYTERYHDSARCMVPVSARAELCVLDRLGTIRYLEAGTLNRIHAPRELAEKRGTALWSSADGSSHALGGGGLVSVVMSEQLALQPLADRPQAAWQRADMAIALRAAPVMERCPAARPFYQLLCACLELRFGGEIGIGRERPEIGDDEIGISREESHP